MSVLFEANTQRLTLFSVLPSLVKNKIQTAVINTIKGIHFLLLKFSHICWCGYQDGTRSFRTHNNKVGL